MVGGGSGNGRRCPWCSVIAAQDDFEVSKMTGRWYITAGPGTWISLIRNLEMT